MATIAIIPARLSSTRLPRKVLLAETGKPLIAHVVEAAQRSTSLDQVIVAADDQQIVDALNEYDIQVVLTDPKHPNGTSRLAQAANDLGLNRDDVIVNIQGDEPELDPALVDAAVDVLVRSSEPMSTLASPIQLGDEPADPNLVKVVTRVGDDGIHRAIYFSRALIPFDREHQGHSSQEQILKHAGLYVYRRDFLERFVQLPISRLESIEQLEQLRAVESGVQIAVAIRPFVHKGIDTPQDYQSFVERHS
jgi:3-deoxy-manno-octulosonate cytidylyltransferase (CMP-KDO synthetase)